MKNEELVAAIQGGERDKLPELWGQVERFVRKKAYRRYLLSNGLGGVEVEDLYQSGYLALVAAVGSYDPAAGRSFIGWLALTLKTAFAEAGGYRSRKQARDPLLHAVSLDVPLSDGEDETLMLSDTLLDPAAEAEVTAVEDRDWERRRRDALEAAISTLEADQQATIRRRYYGVGPTPPPGPERDRDAAAHRAALRALRHPSRSRALLEYRFWGSV